MDDAALLALAARQHGVVGDAQALALGYSRRTVGRRVASGEWRRPLPRVLQCTGAPPTHRQAAMAASLWAGPEACVSHTAAGALRGLDGVRGGRPVRQHPVTHRGRTIYVDFAYPECRLAIEFDSPLWHSGRAKLDGDAERRNLLRAAGWELVTVTYTIVMRRATDTAALVAAAYAVIRGAGGCWRCRWRRRSTW